MELALGLYLMKILKLKNNKPFGNMIDKYIIIDLERRLPFADLGGGVKIFDTIKDARIHCGMYELDKCWIAKLEWQYEEK